MPESRIDYTCSENTNRKSGASLSIKSTHAPPQHIHRTTDWHRLAAVRSTAQTTSTSSPNLSISWPHSCSCPPSGRHVDWCATPAVPLHRFQSQSIAELWHTPYSKPCHSSSASSDALWYTGSASSGALAGILTHDTLHALHASAACETTHSDIVIHFRNNCGVQ
jgi:hypothetical protein